jgi:tetratricopeptide (TPR) repeat protein
MATTAHEPEAGESFWIDQAMAAFQEALGLVDAKTTPGFYGVVLHDIAYTYQKKGDIQQAIAKYQESVEYKRMGDSPEDLATTLLAFADLLIDSGDLTKARSILDEAKPILAKEGSAVRIHKLGAAYESLGQEGQGDAYAEALEVYQAALGLVDADADLGSYATVLRDIGDVYQAQGRLAESVAIYEDAAEHIRGRPDMQRTLASILVDLGRVRRRMPGSSPEEPGDSEESTDPEFED